ncbi:uncharacterized protein LOC113562471 [Ooceraea biroi]|uniref:uncharacterized protein LOC113562471 n=1 Tax=Ooceraea biroi TaxID=2015173 RepID=UPI000F08306F|nr:uncharacterized protein LOC113562471 [Ooceraea biroi]
MVLDDLESDCINKLDFALQTFYRYVDDVFMILPSNKIDKVLEVFNNYRTRLQFTSEIKSNGSINFLDVTITRDKNALITNWYRKPTFSGRYINQFSGHPTRHNISVISGLIDRAILLSDSRFHDSNIELVKTILTNNCYPTSFINRHINNRLRSIRNSNSSDSNNDRHLNKTRITIPYIEGLSGNIRHVLNQAGMDCIYTIPKRLNSVIRLGKDRLSDGQHTGVVYKIDCLNCDRAT